MSSALIVDDEPAICRCFETILGELECSVTIAASAEDGLAHAREHNFDVIVLDVRLPGMDGVAALPQFRELSSAPIIVMTAHGTLSTAVSVVQEGAFEYLPKPFDLDVVTRVLKRALAHSQSVSDAAPAGDGSSGAQAELVGDSLPMQHVYRQIALAAQHDSPVLITGASGTGKELVAHAIHAHSPRRDNPIVPVHLASVNETLMERELFGHAAGAYTGASAPHEGLIGRAHGGTLFLDEIGETSQAVQVKLLRTIESGEYYAVGSSTPETSDFRLVAATNRPLAYLRSSDAFRPDLFYRLSTIHIHVPRLVDRMDDVPVLAGHFLRIDDPLQERTFSDDAITKLMSHPYPGNVRELRNVVLAAASECREQSVPADFVRFAEPARPGPNASPGLASATAEWAESAIAAGDTGLLAKATEILERELLKAALAECDGNRSAAASLLGIHRDTLRERIAKLGEERPDRPPGV